MTKTFALAATPVAILLFLSQPVPAAKPKPPTTVPSTLTAEEREQAYVQSIEKRVQDILAALDLHDPAKSAAVHGALTVQYRALRDWHDAHDTGRDEAAAASLSRLHEQFVGKLAEQLTAEQVETVKDKMTYGKVRVTYDAYGEIVPNLTDAEKVRILAFLKEAREEAIDGGSAEEKSAIFKKYKGRINNYLTADGHDVAQAYKDWGEKQQAKTAAAKVEPPAGPKPDAVVAADGSGQFQSVQAAVNAAPQLTAADRRWVILIKPGTYKERVYVQREKRFVSLVGEDAEKTVLTFDLNANMKGPDDKPIGTFATPSTYIDADDFTCENLTFENSAGPKGQALAIRIDGDRDVFRHCRFIGWQDTILGNRGRHYFDRCYITGAVDFIFGGATEFFDHCHVYCAGSGYITAASTPETQPFGYVFSHCRITAATGELKTYLGRPWRAFASVAFVETEMSAVVRPVGWHNWDKPEREKTARYAEYGSTGPGAQPAARAPWSRQLTAAEAAQLTPQQVLGGADHWDPSSPQKGTTP